MNPGPARFTPAAEEALERLALGWFRAAAQRAFSDPVRVDPSDGEVALLPNAQRRQQRWDHTGVSIVVDTRNDMIVYIYPPEAQS